MLIDPPHLYRRRGQELGLPEELLDTIADVSAKLRARGIPTVLTLRHLAHLTGVPYSYLRKVAAREIDPYHVFEIRRREGRKPRVISSPSPTAMQAQRWILSRILDRLPTHHASFAYQRSRSIRQCAEQHLGACWMIKMDLHNFFHSITERQIYDIFDACGYPPLLALELARLCTRQASARFPSPTTRFRIPYQRHAAIPAYSTHYLGFLPQGAPTSGALANLVARPLDEALTAVAVANRLTYTRYADDIVLSSMSGFSREHARTILRAVCGEIAACGFDVHHRKTRLVPPGARRIVLGLLVDGDRVRLSRDVRHRLSMHLYGVAKFGLVEHQLVRGFSSALGLARHIDGLLAFAHDIDPEWTEARRNQWRQILSQHAPALGLFDPSEVFRSRVEEHVAVMEPWPGL